MCNGLLALLLLSPSAIPQDRTGPITACSDQSHSPILDRKTYRVPFHSVNGLILLDATVNGKPAVLLLDTGSPRSFLVPKFHEARCAKEIYVECVGTEIAFRSSNDCAPVAFYQPEVNLTGFMGQDTLRKFRSVRIDYKNHAVELEEQ